MYRIPIKTWDLAKTHTNTQNSEKVIPEIWQTRQHYKQHCSAMQVNKPLSQIPDFATFDPENKPALLL